MDYAIVAAVAALDAEARPNARMRTIEQRHAAGRCTLCDHYAYRALWIAATFRRSAGLHPRVPITADASLARNKDLMNHVQNSQARLAVDAVFRSAPEDEAADAAHR